MDVQAYLKKKCKERWRAEQIAIKEKENGDRMKKQAYLEPVTQREDRYEITIGTKKKIDINDSTKFVSSEIYDQLKPEEKTIYDLSHSKTHFVTIARVRVDLKDKDTKISRVQYDQLSRDEKQIYLVAHPRDPKKPLNSNKISRELQEYLDHKYGEKGSKGWKKLSTSSFKLA